MTQISQLLWISSSHYIKPNVGGSRSMRRSQVTSGGVLEKWWLHAVNTGGKMVEG